MTGGLSNKMIITKEKNIRALRAAKHHVARMKAGRDPIFDPFETMSGREKRRLVFAMYCLAHFEFSQPMGSLNSYLRNPEQK